MQKNTAGKWVVFAWTTADNLPKTGDAAQITANIRIDGAGANAIDDTNPAELEDGYYIFDITATEANGDNLVLCPASSTSGVQVIGVPGAVWTRPPNFQALSITAGGVASADAVSISGDTTAADNCELMFDGTGYAGGTARLKVDVDTIKTNPVANGGTITFPTNATVASTTNITGGTITTVTNQLSASAIADAVWDEDITDRVTAGLAGTQINDIDTEVDVIYDAIQGIAVTGAALNALAGAGSTLTTGTQSSGTYASTYLDNGVYHVITAAGGSSNARIIDLYYDFPLPNTNCIPTQVKVAGYLREGAPAGGDTISLQAWNGSGWEVLDSEVFTGITTAGPDVTMIHALFSRFVFDVTGVSTVRIRFSNTGTLEDSTTLNIDQIYVSYAEAVSASITAIKTKTDYLPSATAGAAGGVFVAGSNAATSITTGLTANITGNLSGSVGSLATQAKADVNAEVDAALVDINLDHLMKTPTAANDMTAEIANGSALSRILGVDDTANFVPSVDALSVLKAAVTEVGTDVGDGGLGNSVVARLDAIKTKTDYLTEIPLVTSAVVADGGNSATAFKTGLSSAVNDYWKDCLIVLTSGALAGQVKRCTAYNGTTKVLTVSGGFTSTPADDITFSVLNK